MLVLVTRGYWPMNQKNTRTSQRAAEVAFVITAASKITKIKIAFQIFQLP